MLNPTNPNAMKIYREYVGEISPFTEQEEQQFLSGIQPGNQEEKKRFSETHLQLVLDVVDQKLSSLLIDLVQEGNVALFKAVEEYKPQQALSFKNFAGPKIELAIESGLRKFIENNKNKS